MNQFYQGMVAGAFLGCTTGMYIMALMTVKIEGMCWKCRARKRLP